MTGAQEKIQSRWDAAAELVKKNLDQLSYLRGRWEDEQEYEDFNEYAKAIKGMFPGFEITNIKKSKFSFVIKMERPTPDMIVRVGLTQITWKMNISKAERAGLKK